LDVSLGGRLPQRRSKTAVEADLHEGANSQVFNAVPTLIFNQRWILPGAVSESDLRQVIDRLLAGEDPSRI
jgi:predicted DsbA family dithiol-disulfide isomerase